MRSFRGTMTNEKLTGINEGDILKKMSYLLIISVLVNIASVWNCFEYTLYAVQNKLIQKKKKKSLKNKSNAELKQKVDIFWII